MSQQRLISLVAFCIALIASCGFVTNCSAAADTNAQIDFARDIQPILADNCYACHGPDAGKRKSHLRFDLLDPKEGPFAEREGGIPIVPGHTEKSELIRRILADDPDDKMPPAKANRRLTQQQIELLKRWVEQGAKWGKHWSLVPPRRSPLPEVKDAQWARNPIDRFILARLEREGLKHSPEARKQTLIRRVTLDLTGLPPTPAEFDAFLADSSPDAYEKVVDRLLASPRYGERMVWEWLDTARYADTNGYQGDNTRTMWPWRDWAIKAMNDNMPFDQFTAKQIAGDLLPDATLEDKIATAFLRNHMINGEGGRIAEENRVDYVMDQSETVSTAWLGLTVGCARCHDHKFDPITQKDYYSLFAFFNNTPVDGGNGSGQAKPVVDFTTPEQKQKLQELNADLKKRADEVAEIEKTVFPRAENQTAAQSPKAAGVSGNIAEALKLPPEKRYFSTFGEIVQKYKESEPKYVEAMQRLIKAIEARDQFNNGIPRVMVMEEMPKPRDAFILVKGAYDKHADKVTAGTPSSLPLLPAEAKKDRLALANWLVSPEHPLMARVTVNRYWQQFFGTGIVKTAEDFGVQGERPIHPELLDWLATEFIESRWNVKAMHRLIVTSAAYRQSSQVTPDLAERDPENRLLARASRMRLPAYMLRDQALAISGLLVEKMGGSPVKPYQPPGIWEEATFGQIKYQQDHGQSLYRRSVYTFWRRIVGPTEFFDTASRQTCTVRPSRTNTPLHALTTLNDTTYVEAARVLAQRVMTQADGSAEARVEMAYRLVLARRPTNKEMPLLLSAIDRLKGQYAADKPAALKLLSVGESQRDEKLDPVEHAAYTGLCLAILNLDEALTKE
jgi:mono/diheme cytochrome c family protein